MDNPKPPRELRVYTGTRSNNGDEVVWAYVLFFALLLTPGVIYGLWKLIQQLSHYHSL